MTLQELPTYVSMVEEICKDEEKRLKSLLHSIHPEVLVQLGVREESIKHLSIVNIKQVLQIKSININHTYSGVANFLEECGDLQSIILRHGKWINLNHLNKLEKLSLESCEQISMEKILSIKYLFIKQCDRSLLQFNTAVEIDELHIWPYSVNWLWEDRVLKNVKKIYFTWLDQMYNTRIRQMVKESAEKTFPQAEIFNDRVPLI